MDSSWDEWMAGENPSAVLLICESKTITYTSLTTLLHLSVLRYIWGNVLCIWVYPGGSVEKNLPAMQKLQGEVNSVWVWKIPWRSAWQPNTVFLPGESHGWRSLWGTVHEVAKNQTWLKQLRTCTHIYLSKMPYLAQTNLYNIELK